MTISNQHDLQPLSYDIALYSDFSHAKSVTIQITIQTSQIEVTIQMTITINTSQSITLINFVFDVL